MADPQKEFNLINLGNLHRGILVLKEKADAGKRITPKDINDLVAILEHVPAELQQRCNPVDPKEYGG